jgi:homocysteine S-methyltransferase
LYFRLLRDDPDLIYRTHKAYYEAGADVATTASYQATVKGFQELGLDTAAAEELISTSVRLAKKARDDFWAEYQRDGGGERRLPLVAASIGCYGASLADGSEFHGNYRSTMTPEAIKDFHRARMLLLAREGADILACETVALHPCPP